MMQTAPTLVPNTRAKARAKLASVRQPKRAARLNVILSVMMGVTIPAITLALARIGGILWLGAMPALSALSGALGITILAVSLHHLQTAITLITHSSKRKSWALAVAFDGVFVLSELVLVAEVPTLRVVALAMMFALGALSALLNVYAMLRK